MTAYAGNDELEKHVFDNHRWYVHGQNGDLPSFDVSVDHTDMMKKSYAAIKTPLWSHRTEHDSAERCTSQPLRDSKERSCLLTSRSYRSPPSFRHHLLLPPWSYSNLFFVRFALTIFSMYSKSPPHQSQSRRLWSSYLKSPFLWDWHFWSFFWSYFWDPPLLGVSSKDPNVQNLISVVLVPFWTFTRQRYGLQTLLARLRVLIVCLYVIVIEQNRIRKRYEKIRFFWIFLTPHTTTWERNVCACVCYYEYKKEHYYYAVIYTTNMKVLFFTILLLLH